MTSLALQVQCAVSRNVTSPLVQALSNAELTNEQSGLPTAASQQSMERLEWNHERMERTMSSASSTDVFGADGKSHIATTHSSGSSEYASAPGSPALMSASQQPLPNLHKSPASARVLGRDTCAENAPSAQSEISRTPSTSTTGSSHTSSLDTAISSASSADDAPAASTPAHKAENALRIDVIDPSDIVPGQISPVSIASDVDGLLSDLSTVAEIGQLDVHSAEAKINVAKVRRYASLLELVDTERNYADDLATLVLVFFDNLSMMPYFNDQPARQALVIRNADDLLRIHQKMSAKLDAILGDLGLRRPGHHADVDEDKRSDMEKALSPQAEEAVVRVARLFNQMMPSLESYKTFCSRHGEALALIREAERRHTDWDAYERHCAEILRLTRGAHRSGAASRPPSGATTPSMFVNYSASHFTPIVATTSTQSGTGIASMTSSASAIPGMLHGTIRQTSSRLLFRDFLIKPIQRLCLYPLVLQTLQKHSLSVGTPAEELSLAISHMREVADQVDEAGKRRESELRADLILSRVEPNQGVTLSFLRSLGDCQLSGTLDVLHHHRVLDPLVAPLRLKYFGIFLYNGFLLMVKVRKNATYECRQWFPLWAARLSNLEMDGNLIPHSFRLSFKDHHFELAASNAKERQLWIDMLSLAISRANFSPPGAEASFPSSLFLGDAVDFDDSNDAGEAPTPNASRTNEAGGYFDLTGARDRANDPLIEFLAMHAAGAAQTVVSNHRGQQRANSTTWMPTEIPLRHASPNSRSVVDRGMVLSDSVVAARMSRDSGPLSTLYASAGSGLGSTMGSSLGLSRLSAKETATVKIQRRKSCAGLLENAGIEADTHNNQLVSFTATFVQPTTRSRANTRTQLEHSSERDNWKSSLMRKAARVRPASIFAPHGLTLNTDGLGSPTWAPGSASTPTSPTSTSRELPLQEYGGMVFNGTVPLSPKRPTSTSPEDHPHLSLTSSPISGQNSATSSTVNLRTLGGMPVRTRSSLYGVRDSLTASFARRGRTRSAQTEIGDFVAEFGVNSALSSAAVSPMASNVNLPHGSVLDSNQRRPSDEEIVLMQQQQQPPPPSSRSRTNSITSVTGSIRRAFTGATLSHKRSQSDATKAFAASTSVNRQMPVVVSGPMVSEPVALDSGAEISCTGKTSESSPRKLGLGGSLRRSRTMLNYPKTWFRASSPSTMLERVNAEGDVARVPSEPSRAAELPSRIVSRPATALGTRNDVPAPLGSTTTSQTRPVRYSTVADGHRRASDTLLATVKEQRRDAGHAPVRRGSKMLHSLRFLQNNRLSPLTSKAAPQTSIDRSAASSSENGSKFEIIRGRRV
ncbi:hypothetical protein BCV70DRAFT_170063 [Testicularia cyperi]|uniref:DH domain-containing protein n=1 Tax=Testicularia cyperi TaxID=1882483 RepID=A0A317XZP4_9BASI|nr:hypothetical protein BCV70DRAFT_170063 [Testicularia cyperi]